MTTDLVARPEFDFGLPGVTLDKTGLRITTDLTYEQWESIGAALGALADLARFGMGDWLLWGEGMYGEKVAQAVEATGRTKATLLEYVRVSRQVAASRRRLASLSWTHHQLVAAREPSEQDEWLQRAVESRWDVEEFRAVLRGAYPDRRRELAEPVELAADEREVVAAYRELKQRFPRAVTPQVTRAALERQLGVPLEVMCPSCGHLFESKED